MLLLPVKDALDRNTHGSVFAFVPAHGDSKAEEVARELSRSLSEELGHSVLLADFYARGFPLWGTPEAPQRLDGQTWGAFVTQGDAYDTLEAREAHPREIPRLLDHARARYHVTCADLTQAKEVVALEVLRQADSIFVVSNSDAASLAFVQFKATWLRLVGVGERVSLLLRCVPGGASAREAEERTGLRVSAVIETEENLDGLAGWLGGARQAPEHALGLA